MKPLTELRLKENLRFLIRKAGIPISELGRRTATSRKTLYNWECGAAPADLASVKRVASFFELSVDEICFSELGKILNALPVSQSTQALPSQEQVIRYEITVRQIS